ncbi:MAG: cyanophycinase [Gemmataceae bacterium]
MNPRRSPRCAAVSALSALLLLSSASRGEEALDEKPLKGALVICGGGKLPDEISDRFLELAGGNKARLVIIPTASIKADQPELLPTYNYWKARKVAVDLLHVPDRKKADDPKVAERLKNATGVWITGGDQTRLIHSYQGTAIERALHRFLEEGGVIGGTSAGAAVMSRVAIVGGNPDARTATGFGFWPGVVVDQHFQNRNRLARLIGVLGQHPDFMGVGIDEQTAIVVEGSTATVLGKANVSLCWLSKSKQNVKLLKPNDKVDLRAFLKDAGLPPKFMAGAE